MSPKQGNLEIRCSLRRKVAWRNEGPVHGGVWFGSGPTLSPKVETDWTQSARLKAVKLTNSSQVHLQAVWAVSGHGQVSSCGEARHSPCSRHPHPSATTPTFFLCCESSKGCRRRVRRSQALEDGPQLLFRPPGYAERGWIVSASFPSGSGGPPRPA